MPQDYRIIISPEASADLDAIHAYIAQDSSDNAAKMVQCILTAIERLKVVPHRTVFLQRSGKIK